MYFTFFSLNAKMGSVYRKIKRLPVGFPLNVIVAIDITVAQLHIASVERNSRGGCLCKR